LTALVAGMFARSASIIRVVPFSTSALADDDQRQEVVAEDAVAAAGGTKKR
jgi:hypothetical protein